MPVTLADARAAKPAARAWFEQFVPVRKIGITKRDGVFTVRVGIRTDDAPRLPHPVRNSFDGVPVVWEPFDDEAVALGR